MRQVLAVSASAAFAVATIALASPAHANSQVVVTNDGKLTIDGVQTPTNTGTIAGTEFTFTNNYGSAVSLNANNTNLISLNGDDCGFNCSVSSDTPVSIDILPGAASAFTMVNFVDMSDPSALNIAVDLSYSSGGSGGDDSGSSSASGSAPASEIQQFGLPASGNCEDGVTEEMNWSGIGMDGWGISWAQWANDGAGGAVCTRTVMYDTSTAKWVVN